MWIPSRLAKKKGVKMKKKLLQFIFSILFSIVFCFIAVATFCFFSTFAAEVEPRYVFTGTVFLNDTLCCGPGYVLYVQAINVDSAWYSMWQMQSSKWRYFSGAHGPGNYKLRVKYLVNGLYGAYGDTNTYWNGSGTKWVNIHSYSFTPVEDTLQ